MRRSGGRVTERRSHTRTDTHTHTYTHTHTWPLKRAALFCKAGWGWCELDVGPESSEAVNAGAGGENLAGRQKKNHPATEVDGKSQRDSELSRDGTSLAVVGGCVCASLCAPSAEVYHSRLYVLGGIR